MTKQFSIKEIQGIVTAKAKTVTEEIVEAGRKFYCNLYQNHPAWVVARTFKNQSIILRSLDQMCQDETYIPPVPDNDFEGGQCVTPYIVTTFHNVNSDIQTRTHRLWGAISPIRYIFAGSGTDSEGNVFKTWVAQIYDGYGQVSGSAVSPFFTISGDLEPPGGYDIRIVDIVREDGLSDDCGNPPTFAPEPPPDDSDIRGDQTIVNVDGDSYTYNVVVNRDGDNFIGFPPVINVSGVTLNVDVTGIFVNGDNSGQPSGDDDDNGVTKTYLPEKPPTAETIPVPVEESEEEEEVENLVALIINITEKPRNAKIVSGRGAPNIIYAGWVEFKIKRNYFPRTYIDFEDNYFPAPAGADGYAVTFKVGYSGRIVKVISEE